MDIKGTPQRRIGPESDFDWREYELSHWRKDERESPEKNLLYLELLGLGRDFSGKTVLEIGCGPFGGISAFLTAGRRIVVDPLYDAYRKEGLWKGGSDIEVLTDFAEDLSLADQSVDVVFACNSIDHGESILVAFREIARILAPGGDFHLHVHCRRRKQLNKGHRQSFGPGDILWMGRKTGLACTRWKLIPIDPVDGKYPAFVGSFRRLINCSPEVGLLEGMWLRSRNIFWYPPFNRLP